MNTIILKQVSYHTGQFFTKANQLWMLACVGAHTEIQMLRIGEHRSYPWSNAGTVKDGNNITQEEFDKIVGNRDFKPVNVTITVE